MDLSTITYSSRHDSALCKMITVAPLLWYRYLPAPTSPCDRRWSTNRMLWACLSMSLCGLFAFIHVAHTSRNRSICSCLSPVTQLACVKLTLEWMACLFKIVNNCAARQHSACTLAACHLSLISLVSTPQALQGLVSHCLAL